MSRLVVIAALGAVVIAGAFGVLLAGGAHPSEAALHRHYYDLGRHECRPGPIASANSIIYKSVRAQPGGTSSVVVGVAAFDKSVPARYQPAFQAGCRSVN